MGKSNTAIKERQNDLLEPKSTPGKFVFIWNRGGKIDRNTTRCGHVVLSVAVRGEGGQNGSPAKLDTRIKVLKPGLNKVEQGYMDRCDDDIAALKARAEQQGTPLVGMPAWFADGELVRFDSIESMPKRDAIEAIEGSSDLDLLLKIANSDSQHASIARDHLERITSPRPGGGQTILAHFGKH